MKNRNGKTDHPDNRIYAVLVRQIYMRSSIGIIGTIVNASILVFILWAQILHWVLITWFIMIVSVSIIRTVLNREFLRRADTEKNMRRWGQLLIIGLGISGVLWGSTAIFLFPTDSVVHQVFIAFVLAGMVAGAVGVFSALMPVFLSFSIPALSPIIIRFFIIGGEIHTAMGAMTALFAILTFTTARYINNATTELVSLKETFADQLDERTAEVERVNAQLRHEIEERKRAEQELHRLNDVLEQRVADRTKLAESRAKQLQYLAVERIDAEERERERISILLHDDLQQVLAAARFKLQALHDDFPNLIDILEVEQMLSSLIAKSRHLSHELSPSIINHSDLVSALEWLSRQMRERFGLEVKIDNSEGVQDPESRPVKIIIFRAVQELLFNVVKHAGVRNAQVHLSASDERLSITVSDQGKGFEPAIFDTTAAHHGLGLLSLREQASYIGGSFSIESAPGKGGRINLTVPTTLARESPKRVEPVNENSTDRARYNFHHEKDSRIRVMLVDDHKVMRQGLVRLMSGQPDIQLVGEAAGAEAAIELARQIRPDAIIMDVSMPEMDGVEATRLIKNEWPEMRVIGLSMYEDEHVNRAMRQAGAEGFVSKTASLAELLKAIYGTAHDKP